MVGKFVEFFGPGVSKLSIADRATISNMCPEYGATVGYFPIDNNSLDYLLQTGTVLSALKVAPLFRTQGRKLEIFLDFGTISCLFISMNVFVLL